MTLVAKSRVHPLVYAGLGLLLLILIGGGVLMVRWHKRNEEKQAFVLHYQGLMQKSLEKFYGGTGALPANATEFIATDTKALRSPDVITGWSKHDLVSNKLDTRQAVPFEVEMFQKVMRDCQPLAPQWEKALAAARGPLLEREGDLAAQLELFGEPGFKNLAGMKFLEDLARDHKLGDDQLFAFIDAAHHYKAARQSNLPPESLRQYQAAFEKAKQALLDGVAASP